MKAGGPKSVRKHGLPRETTTSAWWYYDKIGIEVYERDRSGVITTARISWRDLIDAYERTLRWEDDK